MGAARAVVEAPAARSSKTKAAVALALGDRSEAREEGWVTWKMLRDRFRSRNGDLALP